MTDLSKFKDLYISESEDQLETLNSVLIKLEKSPEDKELLNNLMRASHTIKGSSATMGYKNTALLAHVLEDVFDYARNDKLSLDKTIIDMLFDAIDSLAKSLNSIKKSNKEASLDLIIKKIKKITGVSTEGIGKSKRNTSGKPIAQKTKKDTVVKDIKTNEKTDKENTEKEDVDKIEEISYIKVPVERLDNLMDLTEELLVDKMKLEQISRELQQQNTSILKDKNNNLKGTIEHLSRLVSDFQYQVMQARLVPVGQIFDRFPRMVRDMSSDQKKKIDLNVEGADIELDRTIIDKLGEPLVHLLRNAIDHGIPASAKAIAGKEKKYEIRLIAKREKEYALIVVEDNGAGIDFDKVKQKAVEKGIIKPQEASILDQKGIIKLLFNPKLSTKEVITETSGRGVGLSVVDSFAKGIGGRIKVETPTSGGTRFILELPLTLAIINALMVEVSGKKFAVPFSNVERSVYVSHKDIKSIGNQDVAVVAGTDIPLMYPSGIFSIGKNTDGELESFHAPQVIPEENTAGKTIVLIKRGDSTAGLVVDRLVGEQEIVVKPLSHILRGTKGFSGSTILGDGTTVLILDAISLIESVQDIYN